MAEEKKAGRPKKVIQDEPQSGDTPETIRVEVPEEVPTEPKLKVETENKPNFITERFDEGTGLSASPHPSVIGGVCEFCGPGVYSKGMKQNLEIDWTVNPETQLGKCRHYDGVRIRCSFCPQNSNWVDSIRHRRFKILEIPPGSGRLTITCDDMKCAARYWDKVSGK